MDKQSELRLKREGDFYEAYNEDADKVAKALNLIKTRNIRTGRDLCGFPVMRNDLLSTLKARYTVIIVERAGLIDIESEA